MNDNLRCGECGGGVLRPSTWTGSVLHAGASIEVPGLECHVCDACGADPVFPDQIRRNDRRIADARRLHDGLLTSDQIRDARETLRLTQAQAAELFGGGANAFSKYERGDVIQSVAMDRLIRLSLAFPFAVELLRRLAGVEPKGPASFQYTGSGHRVERPAASNLAAAAERGESVMSSGWKRAA